MVSRLLSSCWKTRRYVVLSMSSKSVLDSAMMEKSCGLPVTRDLNTQWTHNAQFQKRLRTTPSDDDKDDVEGVRTISPNPAPLLTRSPAYDSKRRRMEESARGRRAVPAVKPIEQGATDLSDRREVRTAMAHEPVSRI